MKKIISFLAVLLLLLCSCSRNEPQKIRTADMLTITNTEETFQGCRERLSNVLSAMKAKVSVLENEHNRVLRIENPSEYFLESDYILTAFDPFLIGSFEITEGFTSEMTDETAQTFYKNQSAGADIIYDSDGQSEFVLKFVSEELVQEYSVEYNRKQDSFRYIKKTETDSGESIDEFFEFSKTDGGAYVMQSMTERCYIQFDSEDEIVCFCCGELREDMFSPENSIYPTPDKTVDKHWVLSNGKARFLNIHSFENGILTHEDCSSGPWKSVKIDADGYESAFYMQ